MSDPPRASMSVRRARASRESAQRGLSRASDRPRDGCIAMLGFGRKDVSGRSDVVGALSSHPAARPRIRPGPVAADALAPAPADDPERGLHFVCLNANISRQFEFLQNAWMMSTKFSGLTGESDPLLGQSRGHSRLPGDGRLHVPRDGAVRPRVTGLPQFVTVRGGAYFFLPEPPRAPRTSPRILKLAARKPGVRTSDE